MIRIIRTDSADPDFKDLVNDLNAELAEKDGSEHVFYSQFNGLEQIKHAVVLYQDQQAASCGAIKSFGDGIMEIKRMYTVPRSRGKGFARKVLQELELWAAELSCRDLVLETGRRQKEAINLYTKAGYRIIPNYGQYAGMENSICFEKTRNDI